MEPAACTSSNRFYDSQAPLVPPSLHRGKGKVSEPPSGRCVLLTSPDLRRFCQQPPSITEVQTSPLKFPLNLNQSHYPRQILITRYIHLSCQLEHSTDSTQTLQHRFVRVLLLAILGIPTHLVSLPQSSSFLRSCSTSYGMDPRYR